MYTYVVKFQLWFWSIFQLSSLPLCWNRKVYDVLLLSLDLELMQVLYDSSEAANFKESLLCLRHDFELQTSEYVKDFKNTENG